MTSANCSATVTQRYAHMADDSLQKATDDMAGVIDRAVSE
jgi:hypothetical protein